VAGNAENRSRRSFLFKVRESIMAVPFIDIDVILRFLTGDDAAKQAAIRMILTRDRFDGITRQEP
jgi:hypothetical protein